MMCRPKAINSETMVLKEEDFLLLKMNNKTAKSNRRRVRFSPVVTSINNSCPRHPLPFEELKDLWYQKRDFALFTLQARELAVLAQVQQQQRLDNLDIVDADDVVMRGLERCSIERQNHKYHAILLTLTSYYSGMSPDETALVARKCTEWSEQVAFVQACHDYCDVYEPTLTTLIPKVTQIRPKFPIISMNRKHTDDSFSHEQRQRRVRRKVTHMA